MTTIIPTMSKGEIQIRAIFENPGLNNKQVALVARSMLVDPGDMGEKTVAWYRSHAKKGTLGKALMAVVNELGGPTMVPSAFTPKTTVAPTRARALDEATMVERLRSLGFHVQAPKPDEPEPEVSSLGLGF
jgi:hypothetical protein